jgi:hypothetical protein
MAIKQPTDHHAIKATPTVCDMDKLAPELRQRGLAQFDAALFISQGPSWLLRSMLHVIKPGGFVYICGPGDGTNRQVIDLLQKVGQTSIPPAEDFFLPAHAYRLVNDFSNKIHFTTARQIDKHESKNSKNSGVNIPPARNNRKPYETRDRSY